jgi:hypothetical protein
MSVITIVTWVLCGAAIAASAVAIFYAVSAIRTLRSIRALSSLAEAARNPGAAIAAMDRKAKQHRGES